MHAWCLRAKNFLELVRGGDLELIVAALGGLFVEAPAEEDRGVPKAITLHVIVLDLAYTFDTQWFPREIFSGVPPALSARQARRPFSHRVGPLPPGMILERAFAQWLEFLHQLTTHRHGERGRDADVMQVPASVVQAEQQRSDKRPRPV